MKKPRPIKVDKFNLDAIQRNTDMIIDKYCLSGRKKTNREKRLTPKHGRWWCVHCDRAMVANGMKCPVCKKRNGKRTLKKETNS